MCPVGSITACLLAINLCSGLRLVGIDLMTAYLVTGYSQCMDQEINSKTNIDWLFKTFSGILFLICLGVALVVSYVIYERTVGLKNLNWKSTTGVVVKRLVNKDKAVVTRYSYSVGDLSYSKIYHNQFDSFALSEGKRIKVLYNPENSNQSRLDLGFSLDVLGLALIDLAFLTVAVVCLAFRLKQSKSIPYEGFQDFEPHYEFESKN